MRHTEVIVIRDDVKSLLAREELRKAEMDLEHVELLRVLKGHEALEGGACYVWRHPRVQHGYV